MAELRKETHAMIFSFDCSRVEGLLTALMALAFIVCWLPHVQISYYGNDAFG